MRQLLTIDDVRKKARDRCQPWATFVRVRDRTICQICGKPVPYDHGEGAHHIVAFGFY